MRWSRISPWPREFLYEDAQIFKVLGVSNRCRLETYRGMEDSEWKRRCKIDAMHPCRKGIRVPDLARYDRKMMNQQFADFDIPEYFCAVHLEGVVQYSEEAYRVDAFTPPDGTGCHTRKCS